MYRDCNPFSRKIGSIFQRQRHSQKFLRCKPLVRSGGMVPPRNHEILNQFLSSGRSFISTSFLWYSVRSSLLSQMSLGFSLLLLNQCSETERFLLLRLENHYKRNVHEADKNVIAFSGRQHWHGLCYTQYFFRRHPKPSVQTAGLMSLQKTQCSMERLDETLQERKV